MSRFAVLVVSVAAVLGVSRAIAQPSLGMTRKAVIRQLGPASDTDGVIWKGTKFQGLPGDSYIYFNDSGKIGAYIWVAAKSVVASKQGRGRSRDIFKKSTLGFVTSRTQDHEVWSDGESYAYSITHDSVIEYFNDEDGLQFRKVDRHFTPPDLDEVDDSDYRAISYAPSLELVTDEENDVLDLWETYLLLPSTSIQKWLMHSRRDWFLQDPRLLIGPRSLSERGQHAVITDIEKEENDYAIFTYYPDTVTNEPTYEVSYAIEEDGTWRFWSPLGISMQGWEEIHIGSIVYHQPRGKTLDERDARAANDFLDSVWGLFHLPRATVNYVLNYGGDVLEPVGLKGSSGLSGIVLGESPVVLTASDNACFRHELVHAALARFNTEHILEEGYAVFLSGDEGEYNYFVLNAAQEINDHPELQLQDILDSRETDDYFSAKYALGAMLVREITHTVGEDDFRKFYRDASTRKLFFAGLQKYLGFSVTGLEKYWRTMIQKEAEAIRTENPQDQENSSSNR